MHLLSSLIITAAKGAHRFLRMQNNPVPNGLKFGEGKLLLQLLSVAGEHALGLSGNGSNILRNLSQQWLSDHPVNTVLSYSCASLSVAGEKNKTHKSSLPATNFVSLEGAPGLSLFSPALLQRNRGLGWIGPSCRPPPSVGLPASRWGLGISCFYH
ncbi:UNVERIFIED_CONTAM: hypothetical protein K2H54_022401 [Gekko kuhli]